MSLFNDDDDEEGMDWLINRSNENRDTRLTANTI